MLVYICLIAAKINFRKNVFLFETENGYQNPLVFAKFAYCGRRNAEEVVVGGGGEGPDLQNI